MPRTRPPYSPAFRQQIVELYRAGRSIADLSREFEPTAEAIRGWIKQADGQEGPHAAGLTTEDREELSRLRRENKQLRLEREILAKAAAWFARETDVIAHGSSRS